MQFPLFESKQLNDETRQSAEGSFVQLTDGVTHYETTKPDAEQTVVLVHGFSVPYFIFDPTFEFLMRSGFRTLRYDLFGRGLSDRPRTRYNIELFNKQLADLLDALRFTRPVNLIGLSMGGPITATFTARHPERIKSLTLIDPAGVRPVSLIRMLKEMTLSRLIEAIVGLVRSEDMLKNSARDFFDPELVGLFLERYKVQMQYKGFKRAILSSALHNMLGSFVESYKGVNKLNIPVLLFWGRNDRTVPFEYSDDLRAMMPNAEFHIIEDCGHIPHYEKPDEFNPILLKFLSERKDRPR
jgi:pimeloyl-ACP methyl ester carboxylesterase